MAGKIDAVRMVHAEVLRLCWCGKTPYLQRNFIQWHACKRENVQALHPRAIESIKKLMR